MSGEEKQLGSYLTPRQIVEKLDQYIVGQTEAKRAVAVALRNRYRRSLLPENLRDEIIPKNILMIGPTGVGKTEIARRMARIVNAPFVKVEATKFTEVGYVGRDVESMVRDLVETSVRMVQQEKMKKVQSQAAINAENRLVQLLVPSRKRTQAARNPFEILFGGGAEPEEQPDMTTEDMDISERRRTVREKLAKGELEDELVTIEVEEQTPSMFDLFQGTGMEQMGMDMQNMFGNLFPKKRKKKRLPVKEARKVLINEEAQKLIDMDEVVTRGDRTGGTKGNHLYR